MDKTRAQHAFLIFITSTFLLRIWFMFEANLLPEEAYYWNYSDHLDFSYLDHPPMVALLIKLGTLIFNVSEWGVRFATIPCWMLTAYYSARLTSLIYKKAGYYAILLLSILPFFFMHSLIITPDIPLILSWSASLYYLYRALVLDEAKGWYWAGLWIGLGLISKYTIVLLGLSTIVYLIKDVKSRHWFLRREPYCCALIALIVFTPVIYWNATHHWASFLFQSSRRFHDYYHFSLPVLAGLVLLFATPTGILSLWFLFSKKYSKNFVARRTRYFFQIYFIVPLLFFAVFSVFHEVKVNWIGPVFLAVVPWFSILIADNQRMTGMTFRRGWTITAAILIVIYSSILWCILLDKPEKLNHYVFKRLLPWENFTVKVHDIAQQLENKTHKTPVIIPLDNYNVASELAFYQRKYFKDNRYPVIGAHIFGLNSLMYQYWSNEDALIGKNIILISNKIGYFSYPNITEKVVSLSPIKYIDYDDHKSHNARGFYYKIVTLAHLK